MVLAGLLTVLAGCSSFPARTGEGSSASVSTVSGWVKKSFLLTDPGHAEFRARYDTVTVDENLTGMIHSLSAGVEVMVFYGPWCSDSRKLVPVFLRIAERAGILDERVRYYTLDRSKKSGDGLTERYAVEKVPTFIFLKGGKEIGRVVESPRTTLEGDIVAILVAAAPHGEL
jgi:thiol-disulfide isomerase/thioredoxin